MTPILIIWMGVPAAIAVGTDLVYTAVTRSVGSVVHLRQKTVNMEAVRWLATGSVPAALITTILVAYFLTSAKNYTQGFITQALAAVLFLVAVSLLIRPWYQDRLKDISVRHRHTWAVVVGVLVGALVALTSVGGGSLTLVALVVLFRITSTSETVGTDVVHSALLTLAAAAARLFTTTVDFHIAALLIVGSLPGVIIGSRVTVHVPETALRVGLAGTLGFVAFRLILP
jgi:uncharacterized membrane protein YfcA